MAYTSKEICERDLTDPSFKFYRLKKNLKERREFLMDGNNMRDEYLGACLDYTRGGMMNATFWENGASGLIEFIQKWMSQNKDKLIWSDEPLPKDLKLPLRDFKSCPRDSSHTGIIANSAGIVRCNHIERDYITKGFVVDEGSRVDEYADLVRHTFREDKPLDPSYYDDDYELVYPEPEYTNYLKAKERYESTDETQEIMNPCWAILVEPETKILSLEAVIDRLNIQEKYRMKFCHDDRSLPCKNPNPERKTYNISCQGHIEENPYVVVPFCGWTMAWYVQKWYEQLPNGTAPVFKKPGERDGFQKFKGFRVVSSED
jgi:hypothetical protein